jgi:mannose-6-phosphate isomerase-like protein (cupin superfamily)
MWRKILIAGGLSLVVATVAVALSSAGVRIPPDSTPPESILVHLDEFYPLHALAPGEATRADKVFSSPRCVVSLVSNRGPLIGRHIHTNVDEIVFVYKGTGEMFINGEWTPVKAGDLHVCPRGTAHATRVVGTNVMEVISIFSPQQPGGNDRLMLDESPK